MIKSSESQVFSLKSVKLNYFLDTIVIDKNIEVIMVTMKTTISLLRAGGLLMSLIPHAKTDAEKAELTGEIRDIQKTVNKFKNSSLEKREYPEKTQPIRVATRKALTKLDLSMQEVIDGKSVPKEKLSFYNELVDSLERLHS